MDKKNEKPSDDEIVAFIDMGDGDTSTEVGYYFGIPASRMYVPLCRLAIEGRIKADRSRKIIRFCPVEKIPKGEVAQPRTPFHKGELKGYDLKEKMRLAEAARNPVTGVV